MAPAVMRTRIPSVIAFGVATLSLLGGCARGPAPATGAGPESRDVPHGRQQPELQHARRSARDHDGPRWLRPIIPPGGAGGLEGTRVVAARVFAFADSQLRYLLGKRNFAQSPFADRMSLEVAVRPAALDDGADLLLALFLDQRRRFHADHTPVFLGDAADLSCVQELDAFFAVLAGAGLDTLLSVTSNHDGFYAGNFTSRHDLDGHLQLTDMPHDWTRACAAPGRFEDLRLTKGRATRRLAARLPPGPAWATEASWAGRGPTGFRDAYLYYLRPLGGGDPGAPPAWGVFLDTVDYRGFDFEASAGAGTTGAVSRQQLRFLDRAMLEASVAAGTAPVTFVVFGHHPLADLEPESRARLRRFLAAHPEIAAYVSAHEHASTERRIALPDGRALPELVVGSTTDAPQAARLIEVHVDARPGSGPAGSGVRRAVASRRLVLDPAAGCADVPPLPPDTLGYTAYRIARDDTPALDIDTLDQILFGLGLDDLAAARTEQGLGALLMENELLRAWARLHAGAPVARTGHDQRALERILGRRYAAGADLAAVWPFLRGQPLPAQGDDRAGGGQAWHAWHDPVTAPVLSVAERGVHRFAAHADTVARLRRLRTATAASRRYFLCHAIHSAAAEARSPRRDHANVLYIR